MNNVFVALCNLGMTAAFSFGLATLPAAGAASPAGPKTVISVHGDEFYLNGQPTYPDRHWQGHKIQGLLLNSRMVQGIFDDRNPQTVQRWAYPDTGQWDAERNTREFLAAMPEWRRHGLLAFTINLQGGSPEGYSKAQPWHNSAIEADGSLRPDYLERLARILNKADDLGMVVILGYFYFGQDERLRDEAAVLAATDQATQWLFDQRHENVLVEINNECNVRYDHDILKPERVHELLQRVKRAERNGRHLLVGTSYGGGTIPRENVVRAADFILIHGNGVSDPDRLAEMVRKTRSVPGYSPKPILFNEDDHFNFERPKNNFMAAIGQFASWGYFDPGTNNYVDGYQSPPVNWGINTQRKREFFQLLAQITGADSVSSPNSLKAAGGVTVIPTNYHGWSDSFVLSNGKAEAIVVPRIGRVMQFGFAGEEGVFWENRSLDGQSLDPAAKDWSKTDWINFGGDKTWPAPESEWSKHTKRSAWRPPPAFDAMPVDARVEGKDVILTSPVDPFLGVRTERRVHLDEEQPVLTITTTYERITGEPARIGVWIITQLKSPTGIYVPLPAQSHFTNGFALLGERPPPSLARKQWGNSAAGHVLNLARNPKAAHKIGTDASTLLWLGQKTALRIDSPRLAGAEYPDQSSSAEVYTNPDPLPYVELEMLGPLHDMKAGDKITQTNIYTLFHRSEATTDQEARKILERLR